MLRTSRPQLVIHIGDPKTGTSSIQQALQDGIIECETRRILPWKSRNAAGVAKTLRRKKQISVEEKFSAVRGWITGSDADIAVLSAEAFSECQPKVLQQVLRDHVPEHAETAQVLAYVRPHASRYLAAFIQRTKTGGYTRDFNSFFAVLQKNDPLQYTQRFGAWRSIFGDRFTLKPFIRSELRGQDIVEDFFAEVLQEQLFAVNEKVEANIAASLRALSGLRHVQIIFGQTGVKDDQRARLGGLISNHYLRQGRMSSERPQLDRTTAEKLRAAYLEDAKALDENFFGRPLMQGELNKSVETATRIPLDIEASTHYTASEVKRLDELASAIAKTFLERPKICLTFSRTQLGGPLSVDGRERLASNRVLVERFDQGLSELGTLLRG